MASEAQPDNGDPAKDDDEFVFDREAYMESEFVDLEYSPFPEGAHEIEIRRARVYTLLGFCTNAYEFFQVAGFLHEFTQNLPDSAAEGVMIAAFRLAWLLRTEVPEGDNWDDAWWFDLVNEIEDDDLRVSLAEWAGRH
jgi:hypothetical protein